MNEIGKTNLSDQTKFRLDEIRKIENYFNSEINQRKLCSKKISKYVTAFDWMKDSEYVKINSVNSLYLIISEVDGYIKEENGNKYLTLVSTDKNKKSIDKIHRTAGWN